MRPLDRTKRAPAPDGRGSFPAPESEAAAAVTPSSREVVLGAIPIAAAVAAYGLSYGVLAVAAGLSPAVAVASSILVLAGGSQFAFVGVLALGGNSLAGAISGLLLNIRYLAFGLAIARVLPGGALPRRAVDSYLVVDESVAIALGQAGPEPRDPAARARWAALATRRFRVVGWSVVTGWIGATALGAYGGQLIADPEVLGLDAAFPAGFLALLAPWLRTRRGQVAAGVGAVLALGLTPVAPPGVPIIAAALGGVVAMLVPVQPVTSMPADGGEA